MIGEKRLIEFIDRAGRPRTVEPHDDGIRRGVETLLGYQISGDSRSASPHGWKQFDVAGIRQLRVTSERLPGSRGDSTQKHRPWDELFARVT